MNVKSLALASAVAVGGLLSVQAANAATWTFTPGGTTTAFGTLPVAGATVDTFDSAPTGPLGTPYVTLLATYTGTANIAVGTSSAAANPAGDNSAKYLFTTTSAASDLLITFSTALTDFGFYWGSVDTYNTPITLHFSNGTSQSFIPGTTPGGPATGGNQTIPATNGYILFDSPGLAVASLELGSQGVAFEIDNVFGVIPSNASTTPLPGTLPLLATGLGGLGLMGWRRKRKSLSATA